MTTAQLEPVLAVGQADDLLGPVRRTRSGRGRGGPEAPPIPGEAAPEAVEVPRSDAPRGLTLKELTLHKSHEGLLARMLGQANEIFFVISSMDLSGQAPFVFPLAEGDAERAYYEVGKGETVKFQLGDGVPVFPEREVAGGIAVSIQVFETDRDLRAFGDQVKAAADAIAEDKTLLAFAKKVLSDPASAAAQLALGPLATIAGIYGKLAAKNRDDQVALFEGYFSARGSWEGKLADSRRDRASIVLGEVGG